MEMHISCKSLQDLTEKPKYLVAFTVGYDQWRNIDVAMKKVNGLDYDFCISLVVFALVINNLHLRVVFCGFHHCSLSL